MKIETKFVDLELFDRHDEVWQIRQYNGGWIIVKVRIFKVTFEDATGTPEVRYNGILAKYYFELTDEGKKLAQAACDERNAEK